MRCSICAATPSTDPIELAARLARDRAPVVVVGDVAMEVPRAPYYEKELDLRLSRSYGPGRYDPNYEVHGLDYPIGYVRWTEQRNMTAFLELVADGRVRPSSLITHRFAIDEAEAAFAALEGEAGVVGIVLSYPERRPESAGLNGGRPAGRSRNRAGRRRPRASRESGSIGAGTFATGTLIPGLADAGFELGAVASASGLSAADAKQRFGFADRARRRGGDHRSRRHRPDRDRDAPRLARSPCARARWQRDIATYVEKPLALTDAELREVMRGAAGHRGTAVRRLQPPSRARGRRAPRAARPAADGSTA